jgi:hypothetical protein
LNKNRINEDSDSADILPVAMAVHRITGLPATARSRNKRGVRIEEGNVIDDNYSGPVLEEAMKANSLLKTTPVTGQYKGVPVIVAPVRNGSNEAVAAIGVVDITGIFDLATLMKHQSVILKQVCGMDPCPLPDEQTAAKR